MINTRTHSMLATSCRWTQATSARMCLARVMPFSHRSRSYARRMGRHRCVKRERSSLFSLSLSLSCVLSPQLYFSFRKYYCCPHSHNTYTTFFYRFGRLGTTGLLRCRCGTASSAWCRQSPASGWAAAHTPLWPAEWPHSQSSELTSLELFIFSIDWSFFKQR